ncbi:DUF5658 family protein [Halococcoides cellulosivorans]|uniref:DUF5658 domain-containing protein n=1 Tax=Halococcoides cellulosivorans TaxID=1679096 RepID=A0A2R4X1R3_9EURY|nr:DUF5658 family protein [Halococcoides cellulosivorans]AWB27740.1 hypothetical protein HARCEL1_08465 [Halococcoides cellulosivorans]
MNSEYTVERATNAVERYRHRIDQSVTAGRIELLLWGAVLAGLVADMATTTVGLEAGLTEGNPLMRWGISVWGPAALVGLKVPIVAVAVGLRLYRVDFGYAAALGLAVLWNVVAAINVVAMV